MRRVGLLALIALFLAGCPHPPKSVVVNGQEVPYEEAAKEAFAKAEDAYAKKDMKTALERYEAFLRDFGKSVLAPDAVFRVGLIHEGEGDVPSAGRAFQKVITDYPGSDFSGEARFHLGMAYFKAERFPEAEDVLKAYEKRPRDAQRTANARVLIAESEEREAKNTAAAGGDGNPKLAESALYRMRAAHDLEDQALAAWQREEAAQSLAKQVDPAVIQPVADEFPDDPVAPRVLIALANAKYGARDYSGALAAANAIVQKFSDSTQLPEAKEILRRAEAREKVDARCIGVLVPLSGNYQGYGQSFLDAVLLAANVFGPEEPGTKLRIAVRDSAFDPPRAAAAVEELFEQEGIVGIVGPIGNKEAAAAAPRAQALGVPLITTAREEGLTEAGPFVFRNSVTAPALAHTMAEVAFEKLGVKRFAILYPDSPTDRDLAFRFWDEVTAKGGEVTGIEHYAPGATDFTAEVDDLVGRSDGFIPARREEWDKIKKAAKEEEQKTHKKVKQIRLPPIVDFDAVFVPDGFKEVGQLLPFFALADVPIGGYTARAKDSKPVIPLGIDAWNYQELITRGGRYAEGAVFADAFFAGSAKPESKAFAEKFFSVYLRAPGTLEALAYDSTAVIADRIKNGATGREKLRDALDGLKGFHGVTGFTGFDKSRDAVSELIVLTVRDKEIKPWTPLPTPN